MLKIVFDNDIEVQLPSTSVYTKTPKRPRNAFFLFRSDYEREQKKLNPQRLQSLISKEAKRIWWKMPKDKRTIYYRMAEVENIAHKKQYPGYSYSPKRKSKSKLVTVTVPQSKSKPEDLEKLNMLAVNNQSSNLNDESITHIQIEEANFVNNFELPNPTLPTSNVDEEYILCGGVETDFLSNMDYDYNAVYVNFLCNKY